MRGAGGGRTLVPWVMCLLVGLPGGGLGAFAAPLRQSFPTQSVAGGFSAAAGQTAPAGGSQTPADAIKLLESRLAESRAELAAALALDDASRTNEPGFTSPEDTSIRRVVQVLTDAADRHGLVEKDPKPQVLFTDFGESALTFELRFWVDVLRANAAQVASDLRQMIAGAFAEHGLVLAFPQRDLHLDTARPIQIQLAQPADRPTPPSGNPKPGSG